MGKQWDIEALLAKARQPSEEALKLHPLYRGKLEVTPKCRIQDFADFAIWYSPGVAAPCREIVTHPDKVFEHTNKGNFVAIVSDGTRVRSRWYGGSPGCTDATRPQGQHE